MPFSLDLVSSGLDALSANLVLHARNGYLIFAVERFRSEFQMPAA